MPLYRPPAVNTILFLFLSPFNQAVRRLLIRKSHGIGPASLSDFLFIFHFLLKQQRKKKRGCKHRGRHGRDVA